MKAISLDGLTAEELAEKFADICIKQDRALFEDDVAGFNRLYGQMDAVRNELKGRPGDQRKALLALLHHPNVQVQLKAAISTLAIAPDLSREVLQRIATSNRLPQAADAGFILDGIRDGSFVPK
jgi:hypothetical protein